MTGSSSPPAGGPNPNWRTLDQIADEQVQTLIESLDGNIIRPDDPEYDEERQVHNGVIDKHPAPLSSCVAGLPTSSPSWISFVRTELWQRYVVVVIS